MEPGMDGGPGSIGGGLRLAAPAKLNLGLEVTGHREDGFHDLATVFQTLELADTVRLVPTADPACSLVLEGDPVGIPAGEDNLALRAAKSYLHSNKAPTCEIHLEKLIPPGAGLGGGSSDAAAVLRGLQQLAPAPLPEADLALLAATLGSDVPFFLLGGTAWATGRGQELTGMTDLALPEITLVLPPCDCPTPACFAALTEEERGPREPCNLNVWLSLWSNKRELALANRLLEPALRIRPELEAVRDWTGACGLPWGLSGSGSTFYLLGRTDREPPTGCRLLATAARPRKALDRL